MSRTNCLLPSKGFCLNFRVRIVKSLIACREGLLRWDGGRRRRRVQRCKDP